MRISLTVYCSKHPEYKKIIDTKVFYAALLPSCKLCNSVCDTVGVSGMAYFPDTMKNNTDLTDNEIHMVNICAKDAIQDNRSVPKSLMLTRILMLCQFVERLRIHNNTAVV